MPLDELLDFRQQHRKEHRKYMSDLRTLCAELSQLEDDVDRQRAHADRRAEIQDAAEQLSRRARTAFSQPKTVATFGLGLIGATVSIAAGNLVGGGISIASQLLHLLPDRKDDTVYSYLFSAQRSFE